MYEREVFPEIIQFNSSFSIFISHESEETQLTNGGVFFGEKTHCALAILNDI